MCGIAGILGLEKVRGEHLILEMADAMTHRGPDGGGVFVDDGIALGHRRLSIIDLTNAASQPFTDHTGRYVIVFNGEIYNYESIRKELDYPWQTSSDTEVLLAAYIQWGADCLQHFSGMFAFAIYDKKNSDLFIARDRLGVKPLYYTIQNGIFAFASEIRTLLKSEQINAQIDPFALKMYLRFGYINTPNTILKDIYQISPGQSCVFRAGKLIKETYWSLLKSDLKVCNYSHSDILAKTNELLTQSVKERMVADVPIGAYLSGGIDSSSIVAIMSELSKQPVHAFTIVFNEKEYDESEYANLIADKYGCKHTNLLLKPEDLLRDLPECFQAMDHPTPDGINSFMVSKLVAKTGIKVVLSGAGGDELFAGYPGFKQWSLFRRFAFLFRIPFLTKAIQNLAKWTSNNGLIKLSELLIKKNKNINAFYSSRRSVCSETRIHSLANLPKEDASSWFDLDAQALSAYPSYSSYSAAELSNYTLEVLLKDTDQMSMAHALEVREPFFDYRLIDFLLGVKDKDKLKGKTPKTLLVEALGIRLPQKLVHRPKKGFTFPWKLWLKKELHNYCEEALLALGERPGFNAEGIAALWSDFKNDKPDTNWLQVWQLVVLQRWMEENAI